MRTIPRILATVASVGAIAAHTPSIAQNAAKFEHQAVTVSADTLKGASLSVIDNKMNFDFARKLQHYYVGMDLGFNFPKALTIKSKKTSSEIFNLEFSSGVRFERSNKLDSKLHKGYVEKAKPRLYARTTANSRPFFTNKTFAIGVNNITEFICGGKIFTYRDSIPYTFNGKTGYRYKNHYKTAYSFSNLTGPYVALNIGPKTKLNTTVGLAFSDSEKAGIGFNIDGVRQIARRFSAFGRFEGTMGQNNSRGLVGVRYALPEGKPVKRSTELPVF